MSRATIFGVRLDLFLLLTAMLCGLTGANRATDVRAPAVEASHIVAVAQVIAPALRRVVAPRPDGYVAPRPMVLDLTMPRGFVLPITPERRRE